MNIAKLCKKFAGVKISPYTEISKPNLRNNLKQLFAMKNLILIFALALASAVNAQQVEFVALNEVCSTDSKIAGIEVTYETSGDRFLSVDVVQTVLPNQSFLIDNSREFDYILATVVDTQGNVVATKMIFPCHLEADKNNVISVY